MTEHKLGELESLEKLAIRDWRKESVSNAVRIVVGQGRKKVILMRACPTQLTERQTHWNVECAVAARNALPELIEHVRKAEAAVLRFADLYDSLDAASRIFHGLAADAERERDFAQGRATAHAITIGRLEARVAELEAERKGKALVGVGQLREIEGTGTAADSYREEAGCPVCGARTPSEYDEEGNERGPQPIPHRQTCWLAHAITEASDGE